jgi:hypothetical protein
MTIANKVCFAFPLVFFAVTAPVHAVALVTYNLNGNVGNEVTEAPSANAPNITGVAISRGTGLTANNAANSFNSQGFDTATVTDFVQLGFTVSPGFTVNLTNLQIATQSSGTGPGTIGLFSSVDSFTTALATISQAPGNNTISSSYGLSGLTGLTGTINFRFLEIGNTQADGVGATANNGSFRLLNNTAANAIIIDGVVTPVPFEFSPAGAALGLTAVFVGKRFIKKAK